MSKERCRNYRADLCIFDTDKETAIMISLCAFHADRCHGDRLYFVNNGPCKTDAGSLDWASVSEQNSVQEPVVQTPVTSGRPAQYQKLASAKSPENIQKMGSKCTA
ncbi:hypothetical protein cypCar_00035313 [Cyprinus carpio]|nr:hypothetical protein cypCar_00035313 [Cyprinus carpio]